MRSMRRLFPRKKNSSARSVLRQAVEGESNALEEESSSLHEFSAWSEASSPEWENEWGAGERMEREGLSGIL